MILSSEITSFLAERRGHIAHWLLWVVAKNRSTGADQPSGLWTGDDDQTFTIGGASRSYFGAGGMFMPEPITYEAGLNIQTQRIDIGPVAGEVEQMLRTFDPRLAPADLYLAVFDPIDNTLVGTARAFKGWVDSAPISESGDPELSTVTCSMVLASSMRAGTRSLALKKSDAAQQERAGDRGRRYADVSGSVPVWWGEKRSSADGSAVTPQSVLRDFPR